MPLITSAGVGSGLDLENIIQATVNAEDLPKLAKFEKKETELNVQLSSIGAIKSSLSSLDDVIAKLADIDNFNKRVATVIQPASGNIISVKTSTVELTLCHQSFPLLRQPSVVSSPLY